ncbi:YpoC family protein [Evansella sp. AB-rgal1]|uniref:YpoC family protein n=1 Tax=Evansella sp. AB-rgal1 TaxID=3242696 RepID=UPI00359CF1FE
MIVPQTFCSPPFYEKNSEITITKFASILESWKDGLFLMDIAFATNVFQDTENPWESPVESVQLAVQYWRESGKPTIEECFKKRDRNGAKPHMVKFLAIYIQVMHWAKGESVTSLDDISDKISSMSYAPMNVSERLQFILNVPNHHHAFTTLDQLFEESKKKLAVYHSKLRK